MSSDNLVNYSISGIPCLHRIHKDNCLAPFDPQWIQWKLGLSININKILERIENWLYQLKQGHYNFETNGLIPITFDDGYKDLLLFNKKFRETNLDNYFQPFFFIPTSIITNKTSVLWVDKLYFILSKLSTENLIKIYNKYEGENSDFTNEEILLKLAKGKLKAKLRLSNNDQQHRILQSIMKDFNIKKNNRKLHRKLYLSKRDVKFLINNNWVLGSHGKFHHRLENILLEKLKEELAESYEVITNWGGNECLAFPDGYFNKNIIDISLEIGYKHLFTLLNDDDDESSKIINRVIW